MAPYEVLMLHKNFKRKTVIAEDIHESTYHRREETLPFWTVVREYKG